MIDIPAAVTFDDMIDYLTERLFIVTNNGPVIRIQDADVDNRYRSLRKNMLQMIFYGRTEISADLYHSVEIIKIRNVERDVIALVVLVVLIVVSDAV